MLSDFLTIAVVCYDPYVDALDLSPRFLEQNVSTNPPDILYVTSGAPLITEHKRISTNGDLSFHGRLRALLENLRTKYVLVLMDDYLVDKPLIIPELTAIVDYLKNNTAHYCQLCNFLRTPRTKRINKFIGGIKDSERYRISLQPSIFSRELLTLLASTNPETPWDGELNLMRPEFKQYKAYYAYNHPIHVVNYIDKGLATRKAYRLLKKQGLWHNQRPIMSMGKTIKKYLVNKLSGFVPQKLKQKLKKGQGIYKG